MLGQTAQKDWIYLPNKDICKIGIRRKVKAIRQVSLKKQREVNDRLFKNLPKPHCQWLSMNMSKIGPSNYKKKILVDYDVVCYPSLRKKKCISNSLRTVSIFYHICPNSYHNSQHRTHTQKYLLFKSLL